MLYEVITVNGHPLRAIYDVGESPPDMEAEAQFSTASRNDAIKELASATARRLVADNPNLIAVVGHRSPFATTTVSRITSYNVCYTKLLRITWSMNDSTTLKSITAYRDLQTDSYIDIDATILQLGDVLVALDQNQFSQEFQLLGDNDADLNWRNNFV